MRFGKRLKSKFVLVLLVVGVVPLSALSAYYYVSVKDALFENVFTELRWTVDETSSLVEDHFIRTAKDLLIASQNTAFEMYFLDPENRDRWVAEQGRTLRYLRSVYPDMLDEACFIDSTGQEVSRIVQDELAHEHDLSSEEERQTFFQRAFELDEGEVYQGEPIISEDTHRWVLPNATPIVVNGEKKAILHFEITMTYFQRLLKKAVNPDRGVGFVLDGDGRFMAHTERDISETEPFPQALADDTPPGLAAVYERMRSGESGLERYTSGGEDFYVVFRPIRTSYSNGVNENRWSFGFILPGEKVFVELDILRYSVYAVTATMALTVLLAFTVGGYISRPIVKLVEGVHRVESGELARVEVTRDDEIGELTRAFNRMAETVKKRDSELEALATTDGLTGLHNYRFLAAQLEREIRIARRFGHTLAFVMIDVDFFKHYNDAQGHSQGDMVLKGVAEALTSSVREVDTVARYGGEEFAVILPESDLDGAAAAAERMRAAVEERVFPFEADQPGGNLTVSVGVAVLAEEMAGARTLVEAADAALYKAKRHGRNRVERAG